MHSIASSRLVSSSGGFWDRPSCLSTGCLSSELPAAHRRRVYFFFLSEPSWGLFSAHSGLVSAHSGLCSAHSGLISMQRAPPAAHRRRVGLVRCVGEGRPLHIADGSVSCVPCARVCVMVVHVHDALVEIQSLVRRKPCLVLYLFF